MAKTDSPLESMSGGLGESKVIRSPSEANCASCRAVKKFPDGRVLSRPLSISRRDDRHASFGSLSKKATNRSVT